MEKLNKALSSKVKSDLGNHQEWAEKTFKFNDQEHSAHLSWAINAHKKDPKFLENPQNKQALEHFSAMYYLPQVRNANLNGKNFNEGIEELKNAEKIGISKNKEKTVPKMGHVMINTSTGKEWRNLGVSGSKAHGEAGNHCGNTPSLANANRTHERGITLESKTKDEKRNNLHVFAVNNAGFLTEIKGNGNKKPAEKYHKDIIELMEHPDIKGFVGGGFLSSSNFDPEDVKNPELKQRIKNIELKKPNFFSPDISDLHESIQQDPFLALTVTNKNRIGEKKVEEEVDNFNHDINHQQQLLDRNEPGSDVHYNLSEFSQHPEIQKQLLERSEPGSGVHLTLAQYSQHPKIQQQLLDWNKPNSDVHYYLALKSQHPEIQKQLLDKSNPGSGVHLNLAQYSQHSEIQKQLLDWNKPGSDVYEKLMANKHLSPEYHNVAEQYFIDRMKSLQEEVDNKEINEYNAARQQQELADNLNTVRSIIVKHKIKTTQDVNFIKKYEHSHNKEISDLAKEVLAKLTNGLKKSERVENLFKTIKNNQTASSLNDKLSEIKDMLSQFILFSNLEKISNIINDLSLKNAKLSTPQIEPQQNKTEALEELKKISTTKLNLETKEEEILLFRPTNSQEYSGSVENNIYKTEKSTIWLVGSENSESHQKTSNPIISCWIPISRISKILNSHDNTGIWGDLGENPFKDEFRVEVNPGSYTIYSELRE